MIIEEIKIFNKFKYCWQLRCGWRPGHISHTVLRKISACRNKCGTCTGVCTGICKKSNLNPCGIPPKCSAPDQRTKDNVSTKSEPHNQSYPDKNNPNISDSNRKGPNNKRGPNVLNRNKRDPNASNPKKKDPNKKVPNKKDPNTTGSNKSESTSEAKSELGKCETNTGGPCTAEPSPPYLRVIRHAGRYTIITDPPNNSPSGPYPLKYVLNCDPNDKDDNVKFSLEAKYNDYCFDYTSSQNSFVLDFSPPEQKCYKPCPKDPCTTCAQSCTTPC